MKIVKNSCFGGFGLSKLAEREYLKLQGKEAFFYKQTKYKHSDGVAEYTRIDNIEDRELMSHTILKDLGKVHKGNLPDDDCYWYCGGIKRDDKDLIAVIEKLGSDAASGYCAELEIVEIPDGIDWEIGEYDGIETIHEQHRSW